MPRKNKSNNEEIGRKFGKPDLERVGLFSETEYITTGEVYNPKRGSTLDYKGVGRQFQTNPPKKGQHTKDVYFDKEFSRILENEASTDLIKLRRKWRIAAKEKNVSNQPFKPASVPPQPSGSGSKYGTIEQQWPIWTTEIDISKFPIKPKAPPPDHTKNFLCKPPKKGSGYGYPNLSIGPSYEYSTDPFDLKHKKELKEHEEHKKKVVGGRPFISVASKLEYFNTFAPLRYSLDTDTKFSKTVVNGKGARAKTQFLVPFKPPSLLGETINKYPSFEPPPELNKKNEVLAMLESDEKKARDNLNPVFKPSGNPKSYPTRSIIEANTPIVMPAWIQKTMISS